MDDITAVIPLELSEELDMSMSAKSIDFNGITFYPKPNRTNEYIIYYVATLRNLSLRLKNDSLTIVNSIHKYFKGNNYTDYSQSEIEQTFIELSDEIGLDILDAEIKKISYGLVIITPAKLNYSALSYHKQTRPVPMLNIARQYGVKYFKTDYNLKAYDKAYEVRVHNGLKSEVDMYRVEVEVKNMKNLHKRKNPIKIYTVKDLFSYEVVQYLMEDLINKYEEIEKEPIYDYSLLSDMQMKVLGIMKTHKLRDFYKKHKNKSYKRFRKVLKEVEILSDTECHQTTISLLYSKATQLLNS
jgi:hypothetical protein